MELLSRLRSGLFGRAAWNLVDQVVVSLTNSVLTFLVAGSVDDVTFGGFAVAFTVFAVLIGVSRAVAASPLAVRYSDADDAEFRTASTAALGASLVLGLAAGLVLLGVGALLGEVGGEGVLALGLVLPGLLVQDTWRQVFFAAGRPAAAAVNSIVWTVLQFAAVALLLVSGLDTVLMLVLAWGGAALLAALLGIVQSRSVPRPAAALAWLREHRDLAGYNVADFGVQQGAMQGTLLLLGSIASVAAIGTVRGTLVLLGMTSVLAMATVSFALPEIARRRRSFTARQWYLVTVALSGLVAGVGILWGLVFLLAPDGLGRALLGESWDGVRAVLLPAIIGQALLAAGLGPSTVVRAMDRAQVTFRRNLVMSPLILVGGVTGTLLGQAEGAFWGFAAAYAVGVPLWAYLVRREVRALVARAADAEPEQPQPEPARRAGPVEPVDPFFADLGTMALPTMQLMAVRPRPRPAPRPARPVARPVPVPRPVGPPAPPPPRVPVPAVPMVPVVADPDGTRAMPLPAGTPVDADGTRALPLSPPPGAPVRPPGAAPPPPGVPGDPAPVRPGHPWFEPGAPLPPPGPPGPAGRPPAVPGRPAAPGPARPGGARPGPHAGPPDGRPGWLPGRPGPGQPGRPPHGPGPGAHGPPAPGVPGPHRPGPHRPGPHGPGPQIPGQQGAVPHVPGRSGPGPRIPGQSGPVAPGPGRPAPGRPVPGPVPPRGAGPAAPSGGASPRPRPADPAPAPDGAPAVGETVRSTSGANPRRDEPPDSGSSVGRANQ